MHGIETIRRINDSFIAKQAAYEAHLERARVHAMMEAEEAKATRPSLVIGYDPDTNAMIVLR